MTTTPNYANYAINADNKKRGSYAVPLLTAGYGERWCAKRSLVHLAG